jgi:hypothetical protein
MRSRVGSENAANLSLTIFEAARGGISTLDRNGKAA